ncbi:MAG TPA: hypothetical protein VGM93_00190, partial [Acidimicrobiales bacterium]
MALPDRPAARSRPRPVHLLAAIVLAFAVVLASSPPASADPAKPSNYRSRVLTSHPALPAGIHVRVVGGDGFLELTSKGHDVEVLDEAQGDGDPSRPYLRIEPDGTVQLNRNSLAYYYNGTRYGSPIPARVERRGLPTDWKTVAHDGRYIWHDHRIHWMSPEHPPSVHGATGKVDMGGPHGDWVVPLIIDGHHTSVIGDLRLYRAPSVLPSLLLVLVVAGLAFLAGTRAPLPITTIAALLGGAGGAAIGWGQHLAVPAAAGFNPLAWALPAFAFGSGMVALVARSPRTRVTAVLAAAAALAGWGVMRY